MVVYYLIIRIKDYKVGIRNLFKIKVIFNVIKLKYIIIQRFMLKFLLNDIIKFVIYLFWDRFYDIE